MPAATACLNASYSARLLAAELAAIPDEHSRNTTRWLNKAPLARSVLRSIPAPVRAARYVSLDPDTSSHPHSDTKCGPRWGFARLHIPVVTNKAAVLHLDGEEHHWAGGELWFGDFSQTHRSSNSGTRPRIHLVIDVLMVRSLAGFFPESWNEYFEHGDVLFNRRARPLPADAAELACEFDRGAVRYTDGALHLVNPGEAPIRLIHLGDNEFRFADWSEERTIQIVREGPTGLEIVHRTRDGKSVRELRVPARSASNSGRTHAHHD